MISSIFNYSPSSSKGKKLGFIGWCTMMISVAMITLGPIMGENIIMYISTFFFSIIYLISAFLLIVHLFLLEEREMDYLKYIRNVSIFLVILVSLCSLLILISMFFKEVEYRFWYIYELSFMSLFFLFHLGFTIITSIYYKKHQRAVHNESLTKIQSEFDNLHEDINENVNEDVIIDLQNEQNPENSLEK